MTQRIILIHGRNIKPAQSEHAKLLNSALLMGMDRLNSPKAAKLRNGTVRVDFAYYGDINNRLMATRSAKARRALTAMDPDRDCACEPPDDLKTAISTLAEFPDYDRAAYAQVKRDNRSKPARDELARLLSRFTEVASNGGLNRLVVPAGTADLGAYFKDRDNTGKLVRGRLSSRLRPALERGDDVMLISHSMGCIVAWDLMWIYAKHRSYGALRRKGNRVGHWMTLGCPLGEAGVKWNLLGRRSRPEKRYFKDMLGKWINISAEDDFVSHDGRMLDEYAWMVDNGYCDSITDSKVYNCFAMKGESNPHKFYGYLANRHVAQVLHDWID